MTCVKDKVGTVDADRSGRADKNCRYPSLPIKCSTSSLDAHGEKTTSSYVHISQGVVGVCFYEIITVLF